MLTLIAFLVVISVLILVHEFGHFFAARSVDIQTPRFSLGLGPRVAGFRAGETEFVISAIPLGGYVKMAGMADDEAAEDLEGGDDDGYVVDPARTFDSKPLWARAWVISAGVIMNMIFAFVVFTGLGAAYGRERPVDPGDPAPIVGMIVPGHPADRAGLKPGDRILTAAGAPVSRWSDLVAAVEGQPGRPIPLEVQRGTARERITVVPRAAAEAGRQVGKIGISPEVKFVREPLSFGGAVVYGAEATTLTAKAIGGILVQLVTGQVSLRNLGGPLSIGKASGDAARLGPERFFEFMALFSVNLAIFNLLPIPVLDGGHLLFLAIEAVRGRALSLATRMRFSQVGLALVMMLMLWALTNDFLVHVFKI